MPFLQDGLVEYLRDGWRLLTQTARFPHTKYFAYFQSVSQAGMKPVDLPYAFECRAGKYIGDH
jgi:hypothetical protein